MTSLALGTRALCGQITLEVPVRPRRSCCTLPDAPPSREWRAKHAFASTGLALLESKEPLRP